MPEHDKTVVDHLRLVHAAAASQEDVVPLLREMFDEHGEAAAAEALLLLPDLPEEAGQAMYMVTHAVERTADDRYVEMLMRQLPGMAEACPRFMAFLLRRVVRSPGCFEVLRQRLPATDGRSNRILVGLFRAGADDAGQTAEFRERCVAGVRALEG